MVTHAIRKLGCYTRDFYDNFKSFAKIWYKHRGTSFDQFWFRSRCGFVEPGLVTVAQRYTGLIGDTIEVIGDAKISPKEKSKNRKLLKENLKTGRTSEENKRNLKGGRTLEVSGEAAGRTVPLLNEMRIRI